MKVAITGGLGFLGWHVACRLRAVSGIDPIRLGRDALADKAAFQQAVKSADVVMHLAGVNRASTPEEVRDGNVALAERLAEAIQVAGPKHVVYANSIQSRLDNAYGEGKRRAAEVLRNAVDGVDGTLSNVVLPNLFGEHGRSHYNSFVATFCEVLANGGVPTLADDKTVPLLHAQEAAQVMIDAASRGVTEEVVPTATPMLVSEVLQKLKRMRDLYDRGEIPPLEDPLTVALFNTYRSYAFPKQFPMRPTVHADGRGSLLEACRAHGGTGLTFVSTTNPGHTRGDHYHLRKVERFFVVKGRAEIRLRRLLHDEVVSFVIDGSEPGFVDMPTMWAHNITNIGAEELITVFWADQLLDTAEPDQYPERVDNEVPA